MFADRPQGVHLRPLVSLRHTVFRFETKPTFLVGSSRLDLRIQVGRSRRYGSFDKLGRRWADAGQTLAQAMFSPNRGYAPRQDISTLYGYLPRAQGQLRRTRYMKLRHEQREIELEG